MIFIVMWLGEATKGLDFREDWGVREMSSTLKRSGQRVGGKLRGRLQSQGKEVFQEAGRAQLCLMPLRSRENEV